MKKVMLFDFFGVISSEISVIWFGNRFSPEEAKRIKEEIVSGADLGLVSEEELFENVGGRCGVPAEQVRREWCELVHINTELVDFIKEIKKSYPVYLLSNAVGRFLHRILEENDLYSLFDGLFISSEAGVMKPHGEFFTQALEKFGIAAEDALFTDDNEKNIEAAKSVGISAVQFTDTNTFKRDFNKYFS